MNLRAIAIETSGRVGSIAIVDAGEVVAEEQFPHGLKHAAGIIVIIDAMLKARGWTPRDVEELYVSAGPGSFTGLRIAVTLAKTMSLATGVKIVAVPTVRVLVENAPAEAKHVIIVLDAKREQIFTARFERGLTRSSGERDGDWIEREGARVDLLTNMLARSPRPVHLLGEGIPYHERFIPRDDTEVLVTPPESWRARASIVAQIGMQMARRGQYTDPLQLAPIYIRKPEAEEKLENQARG